jgi:hypothetical protein
MDLLPDPTEPKSTEIQGDVAASNRPRHPRTFQVLREANLPGRLGDPAPTGSILTSVGLRGHPPTSLGQRVIGLRRDLGLAPQAPRVP